MIPIDMCILWDAGAGRDFWNTTSVMWWAACCGFCLLSFQKPHDHSKRPAVRIYERLQSLMEICKAPKHS